MMMADTRLSFVFPTWTRDKSDFPSNSIPHARKGNSRIANLNILCGLYVSIFTRCKEIPSPVFPFTTRPLSNSPLQGKENSGSPTDKHRSLLQISCCNSFAISLKLFPKNAVQQKVSYVSTLITDEKSEYPIEASSCSCTDVKAGKYVWCSCNLASSHSLLLFALK